MPHWLTRYGWRMLLVAGLVALLALAAACGDDDDDGGEETAGATTPAATEDGGEGEALKIGALLSFTGGLADFGEPIFNGAQLAVDEINANGGVLGQPVELVRADDGTTPQQGVTEAQRLVDVEGVSAIVGALASGVSLQVAETVTGPAGVVQISPASTSPGLTNANDDDFLFRTTLSDAGQGIVLADLAVEKGITTVCSLYVNNAYGEGLNDAFVAAFEEQGGTVTAQVPHEEGQTTYATELGQCGDADTLAAIAYPESAGVFLREAVEGDLFANYLFVDGTKSTDMLDELGWENFEGAVGTAPASLPAEGAASFEERYQEAYGELPPLPFIKEAYDAVYLIALAAEKAGSTDGEAIRDALREIANAPGETVEPGPEGWAAAVELIAGGSDIDYEGVTGPLELDDAGDPTIGAVEWFSVDVANQTFVQDKVWQVDLEAGEVTDITDVTQ